MAIARTLTIPKVGNAILGAMIAAIASATADMRKTAVDPSMVRFAGTEDKEGTR